MSKTMTIPQIIATIAGRTGMPKKDVNAVLDHFTGLARTEAWNGFKVPGIGKLVMVDRPARTCRDPRTGERIELPARKVLKFRVSKACKNTVIRERPI